MLQFIKRNLTFSTYIGRYKRTFIHELYVLPFLAWLKNQKVIYVLHINKAGGTSLIAAIKELQAVKTNTTLLIPLPHKFGLKHISKTAKVAFFIRKPETRFASGYENTLRKGHPHYDLTWSKNEALIFQQFPTFDALIEGMNSENVNTQSLALSAWTEIKHLSLPYRHYVGDVAYLQENLTRVAFVGEQESFSEDWMEFCRVFFSEESQGTPRLNALRNDRTVNSSWTRAVERIYPEEHSIYAILKKRKKELKLAGRN